MSELLCSEISIPYPLTFFFKSVADVDGLEVSDVEGFDSSFFSSGAVNFAHI